MLLSGLMILFGSPFLAIPCTLETIPSRLLFVPIFGLSIAVASAIDMIPKRMQKSVFAVALCLCLVEGIAFSDVVRQLLSASAVDKSIAEQLQAMKSLHLRQGDQIFISLPFDERRMKYWTIEPPLFYHSPYPARLWNAFDTGIKGVKYSSVMRYPKMSEPWGLHTWTEGSLQLASPSRLFPFYMDEVGRVHAISRVELIDPKTHSTITIITGLSSQPASTATTYRVTPDVATQPRCWNVNCPVPQDLPNPTQDH
jgi:hypothetical protein